MAYNQHLAERIIQVLKEKHIHFDEKKMFGGVAFMVDDKMCIGIIKENLMLRVDPEDTDELLKQPGCVPMDFTKKPMKGYIYITPEAIDMDDDLARWMQCALDYNPKAKSSKRK